MVDGIKGILFTEAQLNAMKYQEVMDACMSKYKTIASSDTLENRQIIGMFFVKETTVTMINKVLRQCFPGLDPNQLAQEAYFELFQILLNESQHMMT